MPRQTKYSVTCFLNYKDMWLFMKRDMERKVDPGKLNGIGGKLDEGENYVQAAIRETKEETGYIVTEKDIKLSAVVQLRETYSDDWVMCFFKIDVDSLEIPLKEYNGEGELIWMTAEEALSQRELLVDDLNYTFKEVVAGKEIVFMNAVIDDKNNKVTYDQTAKLT